MLYTNLLPLLFLTFSSVNAGDYVSPLLSLPYSRRF